MLKNRALPAAFAFAFLVACASPQPVSLVPDAARTRTQTGSATFKVLHVFKGGDDGATPHAALVELNGALYGTTLAGGKYNGGVVFRITPDGHETIVHAFNAKAGDGGYVSSPLLVYKGALYGTTRSGGAHGHGTVFRLTPDGQETLLHSFNGADGSDPNAGLIAYGDTFYGTTIYGGAHAGVRHYHLYAGTVYAITPSGSERVLHSFGADDLDGNQPLARLCEFRGILYGTTYHGGNEDGDGAVFSITPSGTERVIHSFGARYDGQYPSTGLTPVGMKLYGVTQQGAHQTSGGVVYSITPAGNESVIYHFVGDASGADPRSDLVNVGDTFYGTAAQSGQYHSGVAFSVTTAGDQRVLYDFNRKVSGIPFAGFTVVNGALYGTSVEGPTGRGLVYRLTP